MLSSCCHRHPGFVSRGGQVTHFRVCFEKPVPDNTRPDMHTVLRSLKENWSPKLMFVFITLFRSFGHIESSFGNYFHVRLVILEKIGFEVGIFPLFGLCHCGLATIVSGTLLRKWWGRCSVCPKNASGCFKSKALLFHKYCFPSWIVYTLSSLEYYIFLVNN